MNKFITPRSSVRSRSPVFFTVVVFLSSFCSSLYAQTVGTIGVADITYKASEQKLWNDANVVKEVAASLNSELVQTRKFTVLDLPQVERRLSTQGLTLAGFYAKEYKSTELLQAGLDYILTVDITDFSFASNGSSDNVKAKGIVSMDFRLLGVADVTADFESQVMAQTSLTLPANSKFDSTNLMRQAVKQASEELVDQVVTTLHPVRIMQINDEGLITLNYGNGFLEADDVVLVYGADQQISLDENGRIVGEPVGRIKVTSARRKFSSAQAIDGFTSLEKGQAGQVVLAQ
ncbi:hypothetical protein [Arenicella sp. 4NH20-0111]|uniref:hypothetical protein n=1 Tax=Arenicella sp. 4NH20-0111 TaxID=3127648 RepID=UPI00333F33D3